MWNCGFRFHPVSSTDIIRRIFNFLITGSCATDWIIGDNGFIPKLSKLSRCGLTESLLCRVIYQTTIKTSVVINQFRTFISISDGLNKHRHIIRNASDTYFTFQLQKWPPWWPYCSVGFPSHLYTFHHITASWPPIFNEPYHLQGRHSAHKWNVTLSYL